VIRKPLTFLLLAAASATALVFTGGAVAHADEPTAEPSVPAPPTAEEPVDPVIAEYQGRKINLAESWEGADSCTELPNGEVHCYDSNEEALSDPDLPAATREETLKAATARSASAPPSGCFADYWCLYMDSGYEGRLLRLSSDGKKDLNEWGCRDNLSSVYYWVGRWALNYGDAQIIDYRSWPVADRVRTLDPPGGWSNFTNLAYPDDGNWNNKVDVFEVRRA
jgi:hypothetical protein